ncbi:tryptophan synthase subunit alpha [Kyrpidia sp.]|uniref:tryptophan synthase subunit alpha n=1 Tax=Kyrpidia sp. TaxID=2073077 RepID=UPI00258FBCBC|nr:tryptophan synthase subunit alpha [Kyrpidia sp.]MCL6574564.1 tryptophan synthase subunit alpha [Kyrpidia sp.]
MSTSLQVALERRRRGGETGFIPFITAGDPTMEVTVEAVRRLVRAGADAVEIGMPYSDPLADGPTIQAASERALRGGFQMPDLFRLGPILREAAGEVPLVAFTYANPVYRWGWQTFAEDLAKAGYAGVIVPDLPMEEATPLREAADRAGVALVPLVAPTSQGRIERICRTARGFVYAVSSTGVTGVRKRMPEHLSRFIDEIRRCTDLPIGVGFGIGTPEAAAAVAETADAVIVGSALVRILAAITEEGRDAGDVLDDLETFARTLVAPLRRAEK